MNDDELRAAHDKLDGERGAEYWAFKEATAEHLAYLAKYKAAKQALPRRPPDPPDEEVLA